MSPTNEDRKIRSDSGTSIQEGAKIGAGGFASAISDALHRDYGDGRSAIKRIARLTSANERAVKNWYDGRNGPSGEFLISLCRHSDQVLEAVLVGAGRTELLESKRLGDVKGKAREVMALLERFLSDA